MAKEKKLFEKGDRVVVARKYATCNDSISCLATRIGCEPGHLHSGELTVFRHANGQLELERPGKAGIHKDVADKYFEKMEQRQKERAPVAA
jgi:hypothetical protein